MMALSSDASPKGARFRRVSTSPGFWDDLGHATTNANEDTEWHFSPESWKTTIQRLRAQHGFQVDVVTPGEYAVARWYGDPNLLPTYALAVDPVMHKRAEEPIEEAGGVVF